MTGKEAPPTPPAGPRYARVRLGYHSIGTHGPVTIAIDRATHKRLFVVDVPALGNVPVPIDEIDYQNLGIEIVRSMGTSYDFTEPMPEPESKGKPKGKSKKPPAP